MSDEFPSLGDWHDTRRSLHAWSKVLSAVRAALGEPHPRWWHISLAVTPRGLTTGPLPTAIGADDGAFRVELDLTTHRLVLDAGDRLQESLPLTDGPSAEHLGSWLLQRLRLGLELEPETARDKWADASRRVYDPGAAERYRRALGSAARVLDEVRDGLDGERGPVQLWAHHFDLSFELFGDRLVAPEAGSGEASAGPQPAQIGFGFFPGDDDGPEAYFYGTPWPFEDRLLTAPLPAPAHWLKEPWEGARLPYAAVVGDGGPLLSRFLLAVHGAGRTVLG